MHGTDIFTAYAFFGKGVPKVFGGKGVPKWYWTNDLTMTPDVAAPNVTPKNQTATTLDEFLKLGGKHWKEYEGTQ